MSGLKQCRACGADIQSNAPFGHCPKCLLKVGFGPMAAEQREETHASSVRDPGGTVRYFGDYELLEQIGRGGMGVVYKAQQRSLHRSVALKMISAGELASPTAVQRFHVEAEAAAKLDHPNIVPIYEIGVHQGQHYFSMKLVEGGSLEELTRRGSIPVRDVALLLVRIARAIHYAHQRGVIHRDLKPGNILLDALGEPHVTDFGLAKILEHEIGVTRTAEVLGTPSYMSPEQVAGRLLTTATDVWSLGVIFYELLTGRPPFRAENTPALLRKIAEEEPGRIAGKNLRPTPRPDSTAQPDSGIANRNSRIDNWIGRDLETICLKCLEKDSERRYASAAALADDLEHWLRDEPILARRATLFERMVLWSRRQPALAAAVILLHAVLLLGIGGVIWQWREAVAARRGEEVERVRAEAGLRRAESAEADALSRLHEAKLNYVRANRVSGRMGQRYGSLAELARAAVRTNSVELRNEAIACLVLPDVRLLRSMSIKSMPRPSDEVCLTADLRHYIAADHPGHLILRDVETDAVVGQIPNQGAPFTDCFFSPDGRFLATTDRAGIARLWSALLLPQPRLLNSSTGAMNLAFTSDSRALVQKFTNDTLHFLSTATGVDEKSVPSVAKLVHRSNFLFSPAGDRAITMAQKNRTIWRTAGVTREMELNLPSDATSGISYLAWHPDGRRIAGSWSQSVGFWDTGPRGLSNDDDKRYPALNEVETRRPRVALEGHDGPVVGLAFSKTGEYLASTAWDHTIRFWHTVLRREALRISDGGNFLRMGTGGDRLAFQSWDHQLLRIYEVARLAAQRFEIPPPASVADIRADGAVFSPNSELVGVANKVGIYLFQPPNPAPLAVLPIARTYSFRFAPDGKSLFTGGEGGVQRWPINRSADRSELHLGLPEVMEPTIGHRVIWVDVSADGQWIVAQARNEVFSFRTTPPFETVLFDPSLELGSPPVVSPDGRWVATVNHSRDRIQVWNARTGRLQTNLAYVYPIAPCFSRDGRWLACAQKDGATIWNVSDWSLRRRIPFPHQDYNHYVAFNPDGRSMVIGVSDREIGVVKVESGEELATLPTDQMITSISYSPDGTRLALAHEPGYLQLWDLRWMRGQLREMNLDWDLPPYPPETPTTANLPLRIIVRTNSTSRSISP